MDFFEREDRIAGSFVFLGKNLWLKILKDIIIPLRCHFLLNLMTATLGMIPNEAIKYKCLIAKWYQAWELRQQGKTFKEVGEIMMIDKSWAASMVSFVNLKIKYQKQRRISNKLKKLIKKYPIFT